MIRFALLILFIALIQNNNYAHFGGDDYVPEIEETVSVKVYMFESTAKAKRYGDLQLEGFEWGLILIGTLLFNIGYWNIKETEETSEEKQNRYIMSVINKGNPKPHVSIEKRKKRKEIFYWCMVIIGFACLYPCLIGLYYHLLRGVIHIIGFAMLIIPFAIPIIMKK